MGSTVIARCKCGYEKRFFIGGGMGDFTTRCSFPSLCKDCKTIVDVNLLGKPPECSACGSAHVVPYDSEEVVERRGDQVVADWNMEDKLGRRLELTDGLYYCPLCDSFNLSFTDAGILFD
jgi:hypothetical protein